MVRLSITHGSKRTAGPKVGKLPYENRLGCYLSRLGVEIAHFGLILDV